MGQAGGFGVLLKFALLSGGIADFLMKVLVDRLTDDRAEDGQDHRPTAALMFEDAIEGRQRAPAGNNAPRLVQADVPLAGRHLGGSGRPAKLHVGRESVTRGPVKSEVV